MEHTPRQSTFCAIKHTLKHLKEQKLNEQRYCNEEKVVFSTNGTETTEHHAKMNLDTDLTAFTKIKSKRIRELNVKHKAIKLLDDNRREPR